MHIRSALLGASLLATSFTSVGDVRACGGCLGPPGESTVISGHRMVLSLASDRTTLWDQITYAGSPSSFAWVLPIRGKVEIGLSSDALFQTLERATAITVSAPPLDCPTPDGCFEPRSTSVVSDRPEVGLGDVPPAEVGILATEVVGPYETVQLHASDSGALASWLGEHGYLIPSEASSILETYVNEGFDFLALKLVPGEGVDSMQPVRVTSAGANPTLPLRMVAVGSGAITPITLWVVGEGRYAPADAPSFTLDPTGLVWDWNTSSSNYSVLRRQALLDRGGAAWLVEAAQPLSGASMSTQLVDLARKDPVRSGYTDPPGGSAADAAEADVEALFGALHPPSIRVTRLHAELSRAALASDLALGASMDQGFVSRMFQATIGIGTPPPCPARPACGDEAGCAIRRRGGAPWGAGGLSLIPALALLWRRRSSSASRA